MAGAAGAGSHVHFRRILLLKPCCIGDVIFATPLLGVLRRAYPDSRIDWAVASPAAGALHGHPHIHTRIDTGPLANPAARPSSLLRLVGALRRGRYDLIVVPDRSRLLAWAALLGGAPVRAGLDSGGRGATYTVRAPVDPHAVRHEAEIYLDVARAMGLDARDAWASAPPSPAALADADALLRELDVDGRRLALVHPGGGVNAGMRMVEKRWPAPNFAALAERVAAALGPDARIAVLGRQSDQAATDTFRAHLQTPPLDLSNRLSLAVTAALASRCALYIGNDNGVAHLAAAAGARTLLIFGPSDPRRYGPFAPPDRARYAWRPVVLPASGVSAGAPLDFDWARDGVTVDEAWEQARALLGLAER
ncbi:MAG: glycosyltransferase family 9 protein [Anaerolineae bacterium]|nr:glycosyltransferase family 9 protein [Anaerolineae bacterium]